ncbi:AAA family ATPase [Neptunicella sp.]|uniref:AAA family ATPase n=1 Tax=Neptunicella sp. TaxID=2125986 RepID=UPI003F6901F5
MAIEFFRQHFSHIQAGRMAGTYRLDHVVELRQEPDLSDDVRAQLNDIRLLSSKKRQITVLMTGPTALTRYYTVTWLAERLVQPVCLIDCAKWSEKYIGETEKNLAKLFSQAQAQQWILFFDEADALFAKRSRAEATHSHLDDGMIDLGFLAKLLANQQELVIFAIKGAQNADTLTQLFSHHLQLN